MTNFEFLDSRGIWSGRSRKGLDFEQHIHDSYEIFLSLSDGLLFLVNNRVYSVNAGDVMFLTNIDMHKIIPPGDQEFERYVITFPQDALPAARGEYEKLMDCFARSDLFHDHKLTLSPEERQAFIALADALNEKEADPEYGQLSRRLALCRLLLFLSRVKKKASESSRPVSRRMLHPQVQQIFDYVDERYNQAISLDQISLSLNYNKHYLCRLFRRETGVTIYDYITFRRISQAAILLREGRSVAGTAGLCGYNSDTFFITTFKSLMGMTPMQYARLWRK